MPILLCNVCTYIRLNKEEMYILDIQYTHIYIYKNT